METLGPGKNHSNSNQYTKLEFPIFNGDELNEWIYKAEQVFEVDVAMEASKVI